MAQRDSYCVVRWRGAKVIGKCGVGEPATHDFDASTVGELEREAD